jgi:gas vesicle protein
MSKAVTAVFSDSNSAENAARQIKEEGLRTEDISIVAKHEDNGVGSIDARSDGAGGDNARSDGARGDGARGDRAGHRGAGSNATGGNGIRSDAAGGDGTGGYGVKDNGAKDNGANDNGVKDNISDGVLTGGVIGSLAGLLIGAGTLMVPGLGIVAAAGPVTGFLAGGAAGGVAGGLIDLGIPEEKSKKYESDIKSGKILFAMNSEEENIDRVSDILRRNGAEKVEVH